MNQNSKSLNEEPSLTVEKLFEKEMLKEKELDLPKQEKNKIINKFGKFFSKN